jgi:predicted glycosyltransferase
LVVPRNSRRAEQKIRARAVENAGGIDTLEPATVTPAQLSAWMHEAVHRRVSREHINLSGLTAVGELAGDLLGVAQHV